MDHQKLNPILFTVLLIICGTTIAWTQQNPRGVQHEWKTDLTKKSVHLDEFTTLLPPDGIPPIYEPKFIDIVEAKKVYFDHEPMIVLEINEEARAYPLSVLMFHEIVNDVMGGIPIIATYCPLCNAAIVYDRRLNIEGKSQTLTFGVSGMLRNSDLVMWDHETQSWWQQITGEALVGNLTGSDLDLIPSLLISFSEFIKSYPKGQILDLPSATGRYGKNPYVNYDDLNKDRPFLYKGEVDQRLPPMERVVDVKVGSKYKIYPYQKIQKDNPVNDEFRGKNIVIFYEFKTVSVLDDAQIRDSKNIGSVGVFDPEIDGKVLKFKKSGELFEDIQTGSIWSLTGKCTKGTYKGRQLKIIPHANHFAFAWLAFHPDSEIYSGD